MTTDQLQQNSYDEHWVDETISRIKNYPSLSPTDSETILSQAIARYATKLINLSMLLSIIKLLILQAKKNSPELSYIFTDLATINITSDKMLINNTLIHVLRQLTNT